jgi:hypothetical protein
MELPPVAGQKLEHGKERGALVAIRQRVVLGQVDEQHAGLVTRSG